MRHVGEDGTHVWAEREMKEGGKKLAWGGSERRGHERERRSAEAERQLARESGEFKPPERG